MKKKNINQPKVPRFISNNYYDGLHFLHLSQELGKDYLSKLPLISKKLFPEQQEKVAPVIFTTKGLIDIICQCKDHGDNTNNSFFDLPTETFTSQEQCHFNDQQIEQITELTFTAFQEILQNELRQKEDNDFAGHQINNLQDRLNDTNYFLNKKDQDKKLQNEPVNQFLIEHRSVRGPFREALLTTINYYQAMTEDNEVLNEENMQEATTFLKEFFTVENQEELKDLWEKNYNIPFMQFNFWDQIERNLHPEKYKKKETKFRNLFIKKSLDNIIYGFGKDFDPNKSDTVTMFGIPILVATIDAILGTYPGASDTALLGTLLLAMALPATLHSIKEQKIEIILTKSAPIAVVLYVILVAMNPLYIDQININIPIKEILEKLISLTTNHGNDYKNLGDGTAQLIDNIKNIEPNQIVSFLQKAADNHNAGEEIFKTYINIDPQKTPRKWIVDFFSDTLQISDYLNSFPLTKWIMPLREKMPNYPISASFLFGVKLMINSITSYLGASQMSREERIATLFSTGLDKHNLASIIGALKIDKAHDFGDSYAKSVANPIKFDLKESDNFPLIFRETLDIIKKKHDISSIHPDKIEALIKACLSLTEGNGGALEEGSSNNKSNLHTQRKSKKTMGNNQKRTALINTAR